MHKLLLLVALMGLGSGVAAANSIDFDTGIFQSGTLLGSFLGSVNVDIVGSLNTIDFITGTLVKTTVGCPMGSTCFDFTTGSVKVSDSTGTVFFDTLSGGIAIEEDGTASLQAVLTTGSGVKVGSATATFDFTGSKITSGSADVSFERSIATPEPASLFLFGSGLVGLVLTKFRKRIRVNAAH